MDVALVSKVITMGSGIRQAGRRSRADGTAHGKVIGSSNSDFARVRNLRAPEGKSLYFGTSQGSPVLYEFDRGRLTEPTWRTRHRDYYTIGDRLGVGKVNRRMLAKMFPKAELEPKQKASWGTLLLMVLGEGEEDFETGWEIVSIRQKDANGWDGEIQFLPYFVNPDTKRRHYGSLQKLSGDELQWSFSHQRIGKHLAQTAEVMETAAVVIVEAGMGGGTAALRNGIKLGAQKSVKRAIKTKLKDELTDNAAKGALRKAVRGALTLLLKSLDSVLVAGAVAFVQETLVSLLRDAKGRTDVLKVAWDLYDWPVTTVIGKSNTWVIQWELALRRAAIKSAAAMVEESIGSLMEKHAKAEIAMDKEIAKALDGTAIVHIRKFGFEEELAAMVYKWVLADNGARIVKVIGLAAAQSNTQQSFAANVKKELHQDLKSWLKKAFVGSVEKFGG